MGTLTDRVAVVTGAARGIGRATALRLAREGAAVLAVDLDAAGAEETAAAIAAAGGRAQGRRVDVTSASDRAAMVEAAVGAYGRVDILVNNAGIIRVGWPEAIAEADWDAIFAVNVKALFFCCQAVLPGMRAQGFGRIINVASQGGKLPTPMYAHYGASKAAVIHLTRSLGVHYAPHGIRVNAVCPGLVDTEMWAQIDREAGVDLLGLAPGEHLRRRAQAIPVGRLETPDDVAGLIAFLCGPDADYMTGQAINITGGMCLY